MFPRRERLQRKTLSTALPAGRRISSPNFTLILPKESEGYAVIVSKKTARLSVTRHRIKRRVFGALRELAASSLPPALVVFPKSSVSRMRSHDIQTEIANLLPSFR